MRKFTILGLIFLLIGFQVFADVTLTLEPKATVKAKAELEIAFDFDADSGNGDFVINNTTDVDVILDLIDKQTQTKGNEEGTEEAVIGFIEVKDIQSQLTSKKTAEFRGTATPAGADAAQITNFDRIITESNNRINSIGTPDTPAEQEEVQRLRDRITEATTNRTAIFDRLNRAASTYHLPSERILAVPSVTARVNFIGPNLYLQVSTTKQEFDIDVFQDFSVFDAEDFAGDIKRGVELAVNTGDNIRGSLAIGTINDIIDASVILADEGTDADDLSIGLTFNLKALKDITGLTIKGNFIFDNEEFSNYTYTPRSARIGDLVTNGIAFGGALDWNLNAITSLKEMLGDDINIGVGVSYEGITFFGGSTSNTDLFSELSARLGAKLWGATIDLYWATDLGIQGRDDNEAGHDIRFRVSTDKLKIGDFNLNDIFKLTFTLDANIDRGTLLGLKTDFDLNIIKDIIVPYVNFAFLDDQRNNADNFEYQIRGGVKIPIIENVDFDVFYENNDITNSSRRTGDNEERGKVGVLTTVKI